MDNKLVNELRSLRKHLHKNPELSGEESNTSQYITNYVQQYEPDRILTGLGGHGVAVIYEWGNGSPEILIRCELDALPIHESNSFEHRSKNHDVSHKCGHDGHMTMVAGLCPFLQQATFQNGRVVLLFQPAEEIGSGAQSVLKDRLFEAINPNYAFALHNIPGHPMSEVILPRDYFNATVQSCRINLNGRTSHAAEPELGINPSVPIAELVQMCDTWQNPDVNDPFYSLITPIHIVVGKPDYGISPGYGELHLTMRSWSKEVMDSLKNKILEGLEECQKRFNLEIDVAWIDFFPGVVNHNECFEMIMHAASENELSLHIPQHPFKFGEDFGWFSQQYPSAMFGLGSGLHTPNLHNPSYDFPDGLTPVGIKLFKSLISQVLNS